MTVEITVLAGLPPYGPPAVPFTRTPHAEGFVVRFASSDGTAWVGNFGRGSADVDLVATFPGSASIVVVASGEGYVVDPDRRVATSTFGSQIGWAQWHPTKPWLLTGNGLWFEAIGDSGRVWRSRRVSWDGTREVRVEENAITGEAWHFTDRWYPFAVTLDSGSAEGGAYDESVG